jgi:abnormal spindle-like microcephaly-associated protein
MRLLTVGALEEKQQVQSHMTTRPMLPKAHRRTSILPPRNFEETTEDNPRPTILARPAHRMSILPEPQVRPTHRMSILPEAQAMKRSSRRVSTLLAERQVNEKAPIARVNPEPQHRENSIKKEPRRRTIFVPSDDTTIMTIHPGQFPTIPREPTRHERRRYTQSRPFEQDSDEKFDLMALSEEEAQPEQPPPPVARRGGPRKSMASAPKRAPLQPSLRGVQESVGDRDYMGQGAGKENIPPDGAIKIMESQKLRAKKEDIIITINGSRERDSKCPSSREKPEAQQKKVWGAGLGSSDIQRDGAIPRIRERHAESRKRRSNESVEESPRTKLLKARENQAGALERRTQPPAPSRRMAYGLKAPSPPNTLQRSSVYAQYEVPKRQERIPTKLSVPIVDPFIINAPEYPILTENITRPEMYEDNWLACQEAAITQLLNGLFESADEDAKSALGHEDLRKTLLGVYHEPAFPLLYKRIQASLLYGALSIPKEVLDRAGRLKEDLGLRKRFLDMWLETYCIEGLKAAAEVVIGRAIPTPARLSGSDSKSRRTKAERRALENFLETFLIRNEDAVHPKNTVGSIGNIVKGRIAGPDAGNGDFGSHGWTWRRTMLRSLMMIALLDKGKNANQIKGCLFQQTSQHKSSAEVLQYLASHLMPSFGDVARPLSHLNYSVTHSQYPLEEYSYKITNLATDMRDGVRLTRMVELLLYPPSALQRQNDITVTLPTGELLTTFANHGDSWVLSHHLKFPTIGRPQKLFNVQLALAALDGVERGWGNRAGVKAEEIVDGWREKTIGLLWGLVSKWGLNSLLDWDALRKETRHLKSQLESQRARGRSFAFHEDDESSEDEDEADLRPGLELYTHLLKNWAKAVAQLHGTKVMNLTTSFADGKVFEAIVDEYEKYFPVRELKRETRQSTGSLLEEKLKGVGCSGYFSGLFGRNVRYGRLFDKDFVIASLAFLCSRLLQASIKGRVSVHNFVSIPPLPKLTITQAAISIQRTFRNRNLQRTIHSRIVLLKLAHDCSTVVNTRDRVIRAATVIQRTYRAHLGRKIDGLVEDVTRVQSLVRGWQVRVNTQGMGCSSYKVERLEIDQEQDTEREEVVEGYTIEDYREEQSADESDIWATAV